MNVNGSRGGVLLCYDGSRRSGEAIRRAGSLLAPARAIALHVWRAEAATPTGLSAEEREAADCAATAVELAVEAGFEASPLSLQAGERVADTILQTIESHRPAVVVLGSRGMSELASAILGSVSTSVVHESPQPVLVIPPAVTREESA